MAAVMTGDDLHALRKRLGMGIVGFGRALGYVDAEASTVSRKVRRYEAFGGETIPAAVMLRALAAEQQWNTKSAMLTPSRGRA
jgi:hypothetical protein